MNKRIKEKKKEKKKIKQKKRKTKRRKKRKRTNERNKKRKRRKSEKGITKTFLCTQASNPYLDVPLLVGMNDDE